MDTLETFEDELGLDALAYEEVTRYESTIDTGVDYMHLEYTVDVMKSWPTYDVNGESSILRKRKYETTKNN